MRITLFLIIISFSTAFSQTDWVKWEKVEYSYEKPNEYRHRVYSFEADHAGEFIAKSIGNAYWFFISDLDGDNCPFRPSCSFFLIQSAKETNLLQGTLMFFDRFTRDMNIYKGHDHYPRVKKGYYYDPITLYTLDEDKIEYTPPSVIVKD